VATARNENVFSALAVVGTETAQVPAVALPLWDTGVPEHVAFA
jgi:hypothetical protein